MDTLAINKLNKKKQFNIKWSMNVIISMLCYSPNATESREAYNSKTETVFISVAWK